MIDLIKYSIDKSLRKNNSEKNERNSPHEKKQYKRIFKSIFPVEKKIDLLNFR